jgi:hypothetical protein
MFRWWIGRSIATVNGCDVNFEERLNDLVYLEVQKPYTHKCVGTSHFCLHVAAHRGTVERTRLYNLNADGCAQGRASARIFADVSLPSINSVKQSPVPTD